MSDWQKQACFVTVCDRTEDSKTKAVALALLEAAASTVDVEIDLKSGVCTEYYENRDLSWVYARRSASEICSNPYPNDGILDTSQASPEDSQS
ncbi:MAG: hypothetical protein DRR06_20430 [Gammaproteobacteria bacterium]|nr:MAG: hypothetical protein DRR06_20430 [Gammaproteobacteria bacterium]